MLGNQLFDVESSLLVKGLQTLCGRAGRAKAEIQKFALISLKAKFILSVDRVTMPVGVRQADTWSRLAESTQNWDC